MEIAARTDGGRTCLGLAGELTIYDAAELRQSLADALRDVGALDLDLAGITDIDTAGIQVLMAAKNSMRARGGELRLLNHSASVLGLIELYDLASWFGDPLLLPPAGAARAS